MKNEENPHFLTKRRMKIWKYEKKVLSLQKI